jgi:S1-C subfamily serine protease
VGHAVAGAGPHALVADLAAVAARLLQITVAVRARGLGGGSGVIWRPHGLIVTSAHVMFGPLADVRGRVVGINTMIAGGLALAVPSSAVQALVMRAGRP